MSLRGVFATFALLAVLVFFTAPEISGRAFPGPAAAQTAASPGEAVLTFPFENTGHDASLDWLSEGLAELTNERIEGQGPQPLSRQERLNALQSMGLPAAAPLTIATMYKVADQTDADNVIFGRFSSDGKTLKITARVLRIGPPSLSPEFTESGALGDLMALESRLAWRLLCALEPGPPGSGACGNAGSEGEFRARQTPLLPSAFELYIRGLISPNDEQRLRDLREAARLDPAWDAPVLALGEDYFARQDCDSALVWLSRVPPALPGGIRAGFAAGVCHLLLNDPPRAEAAFRALVDRPAGVPPAPGPLPEARNNLAIALAREGKTADAIDALKRVTQLDPDEPDYWFNLGLMQLQAGQPAAAVPSLQSALRLVSSDTQARSLLAMALQQSGHPDEAAAQRQSLGAAAGAAADPGSGDAVDLLRLARIRMHPDPESLRPPPAQPADAASPGAASLGGDASLGLYLQRGRRLLRVGDLDGAQRAFVEALQLAPLDAAAHAGLAEVYRRQGRPDDGIREFRAALASRDDPVTRVALARLLLEDNQPAEARLELQQALKLQPDNAEAQQLLDQLEDRAGDRP